MNNNNNNDNNNNNSRLPKRRNARDAPRLSAVGSSPAWSSPAAPRLSYSIIYHSIL